jgi:hypothetical protein
MASTHRFVLKAEYGSWEYVLYWGFEVDFEAKQLKIFGEEFEEVVCPLTPEQAATFFQDAEKFKVYELPSTNYDVDHTDDLYHMGVSIDISSLQGNKRFLHKVPQGELGKLEGKELLLIIANSFFYVLVMVATRRLTKADYIAFSSFVRISVRRVLEISQKRAPPPDFVMAKMANSKAQIEALSD